ncbi:hypothetical protein LTR78_009301 [Recurvomyces mirabilis]|uniref:Uncharacterized protein n=1 Tax=Recurvomyces mirabilis TaxID=574656 RepID=A0AAE0TS33_9PEZI|nr:hypothetical protein LTR78_009301 [Recurvomyces mirabilis]KAK5156138.1 hypothetical protein LTS14_005025 [Recurvomyces mirabilis]
MDRTTTTTGPLERTSLPEETPDIFTIGGVFRLMAIIVCCGLLFFAALFICCLYADHVKRLRQKVPQRSGAAKAEEEGYGTFQHTTSTQVATNKDSPDQLELGNPPPPYTPDPLGRAEADVFHPSIRESQRSQDDVEGVIEHFMSPPSPEELLL